MSFRRGRRLGLDIGSVRIGVASSDPDGILATPLTVVRRADEPAALRQLRDIVDEYDPI
ncbi:MAG: RuvX/YqgF family protein, partial [Brevibacterium linens]